MRQQLAANIIDDNTLGAVRGGFDAGNGLQLSFSFQQQTFVNSELVQTVVVPTMTLSRNFTTGVIGPSPTLPATGATPLVLTPTSSATVARAPALNLSSSPLGQLAVGQSPSGVATWGPTSSTVVSNGIAQTRLNGLPPSVQTQVNNGLQPLIASGAATVLNNGATSVVSAVGNGGLTNVINNNANNQLIQQTARLNVDLTGLSQILRQGSVPGVAGRLATSGALFR